MRVLRRSHGCTVAIQSTTDSLCEDTLAVQWVLDSLGFRDILVWETGNHAP